MANPLIAQGQLNRLIASVVFPSNPTLNVTASYLGKQGIRLALEGNATTYITTMVGAVPSPEPYMAITSSIHLLKTQILAALFKAQMELSSPVGDMNIFPDIPLGSGGLPSYNLLNCSVQNVREMVFDGTDAGWMVTVGGFYNINAALWG